MNTLFALDLLDSGNARARKTREKAFPAGWSAGARVDSLCVLVQSVGWPNWWWVLALSLCGSLAIFLIAVMGFAKSLGESRGIAVDLRSLGRVFIRILGFGDSLSRPQHCAATLKSTAASRDRGID